jgi:hypothetical protein
VYGDHIRSGSLVSKVTFDIVGRSKLWEGLQIAKVLEKLSRSLKMRPCQENLITTKRKPFLTIIVFVLLLGFLVAMVAATGHV